MIPFTNREAYITKLLAYKYKDLIQVISGLKRFGKSALLDLYSNGGAYSMAKSGVSQKMINENSQHITNSRTIL